LEVVDQKGVGRGMKAEEVNDILTLMEALGEEDVEMGPYCTGKKVEKETLNEVEAGVVSRFRQPWSRGYCSSKIPDKQIRAHCDPSLIMTRCRGISCF
jgi:hypothetical protein